MGFLDSLRQNLHQRHLKKLLAKRSVKRQSLSLDEAKTIGILFDGTELNDRDEVLKYAEKLRKLKKQVRLLAFMNNRNDNDSLSFRNFNKKEIDFILRPKSQDAQDFIDMPFDILMNLSSKSLLPLDYIALNSKARFRVGPLLEGSHAYDLMIDLGDNPKVSELTKQIDLFLNKMNPSHEKSAV